MHSVTVSMPLVLFLIGLFLVGFAGSRVGRAPAALSDPLKLAGFSPKERRKVRMMIYRRVLPDDPALKGWLFEQAAYDAAMSTVAFVWAPLVILGFLLLSCVLYLLPVIAPCVAVGQCVFTLYWLPIWAVDCRRVMYSKRLLRDGNFGSPLTAPRGD